MIVVILASDGEAGCTITLAAWKGTGTPAASYTMTEVSPGRYESAEIAGLVGEFYVEMTNSADELVYVGYVNFDGGSRGQADDQPVSLAPPVVTTPPTTEGDITPSSGTLTVPLNAQEIAGVNSLAANYKVSLQLNSDGQIEL